MAVAAVTARIPVRTYSEANRRNHWATRARRARDQKAVTEALLRAKVWAAMGLDGVAENALVTVSLVRRASRTLDGDNLQGALKAVRDAVAGLLGLDDADPRLIWVYSQKRDADYAVDVKIEVEQKQGR
jgi:hypothetical protein